MFWRILLYPPIFLRRYKAISREVKETLINEEIRFKELRVVSDDGQQLGIMPRDEALALSEEKDMDLVCIAPKADPPVCKILDYGKYRFEMQKKEKEAKMAAKTRKLKQKASAEGQNAEAAKESAAKPAEAKTSE